jgi:hypothetical protein
MNIADVALVVALVALLVLILAALGYRIHRHPPDNSVTGRVARSAAWLDAYFREPHVWARAIDLDRLQHDINGGVLEQLFGSFKRGLDRLPLRILGNDSFVMWPEQRKAWVAEITKRREA